MDEDIRKRTVLTIITENGFEPLMDENEPKAENMMTRIWYGREQIDCEGGILHFSLFAYILNHFFHLHELKAKQEGHGFKEAVTRNYQPDLDYDFSY